MITLTPQSNTKKRINLKGWSFGFDATAISNKIKTALGRQLIWEADQGRGGKIEKDYFKADDAASESLEAALAKAFQETLQYQLCDECEITARFSGWHGKVEIEISLPFGEFSDCKQPAWEFNLRELIIDQIDDWGDFEEYGDLRLSDENRERHEKFVAALEAEAAFARKLLNEAKRVDDQGNEITS